MLICETARARRRTGVGAALTGNGLEILEARALLAAFDLRDYLPTDSRDTWAYVDVLDRSRAGTTATLAFGAATGPLAKPGQEAAVFSFTSDNVASGFSMRFRLGPAGLTVFAQTRTGVLEDVLAEPVGFFSRIVYPATDTSRGLRLAPVHVETGDRFEYSRPARGSESLPLNDTWTGLASGVVRVDGVETIITQAGMFEALRITWTGAITQTGSFGWTGSIEQTQTLWLVKGVGIARYAYAHSEINSERTFREDAFDLHLTDASLLRVASGFTVTGGAAGGEVPFRSERARFSDGTAFGMVSLGAARERTFTITNTTPYPLMLGALPGDRIDVRIGAAADNDTGAADFAIVHTGSWFVEPGQSTSFTVRFAPSKVGVRTADITIAAPEGFTPFSFRVRGTGV